MRDFPYRELFEVTGSGDEMFYALHRFDINKQNIFFIPATMTIARKKFNQKTFPVPASEKSSHFFWGREIWFLNFEAVHIWLANPRILWSRTARIQIASSSRNILGKESAFCRPRLSTTKTVREENKLELEIWSAKPQIRNIFT